MTLKIFIAGPMVVLATKYKADNAITAAAIKALKCSVLLSDAACSLAAIAVRNCRYSKMTVTALSVAIAYSAIRYSVVGP